MRLQNRKKICLRYIAIKSMAQMNWFVTSLSNVVSFVCQEEKKKVIPPLPIFSSRLTLFYDILIWGEFFLHFETYLTFYYYFHTFVYFEMQDPTDPHIAWFICEFDRSSYSTTQL